MARYSRSRARTRRTYRKKARRGGRKSARTRRTRGPSRFRPIKQSTTYTFQRTIESAVFNTDPGGAAPTISTDNVLYSTIGPQDTTPVYAVEGTLNTGLSFIDRLQQVQNNVDFVSLFQYFRVTKITRKFVPVIPLGTMQKGYINANEVTDDQTWQQGYPTPTLMVLNDYDSNEPVTAAVARETMGVRRIKMNKTFTHSFTPRPSMPVGQTTTGGSLFAVVPKRCPWMNLDDATLVQLYGARYGILDWPGPTNDVGDVEGDQVPYAWRIYTTYTIQCKGLR